MSKRDYYDILGITPDATDKELKKAYRSLARKYHPDLNPDKADAEAMFKLMGEAYNVLSDKAQRAVYDQFGHQGLEAHKHGGSTGAGFETVDEIFAQFNDLFGDVFSFDADPTVQDKSSATPRKGKDLRHTLELTFKEAIKGTKRTFKILRKHICEGCDGEGTEPGSQPETCPHCNGKGKVQITQGFFSVSSRCNHCQGQGVLIADPCVFCDGTGLEEEERELKLTVPAGIEDGSRLRIKKEGEPGFAGGDPGDLLVSIKVQPSDTFERDGVNLHYRAPISFLHAALGCTLRIPTLGDETTIDVPPGTQFGATIHLKGKGVKHVKTKNHGDLIVHLLLVAPSAEESSQHNEILQELAKKLGIETSGKVSALDVDVNTYWDPQQDPYKNSTAKKDKKQKKKKDKKSKKEHPTAHAVSSLEQMLKQAEQALGTPKK